MKRFAALFHRLDQTSRTSLKVAALAEYFAEAPEADRLWTIALFSGRRPRRAISGPKLRDWAAEAAGLPLWLVEESHAVVGDLAETIALILPPAEASAERSLAGWITHIKSLAALPEEARKAAISEAWNSVSADQRIVLGKLLTGGFRLGVSQKLMTRALARATGRDEAELAHRLMGDWTPETTSWARLIERDDPEAAASRPYPFCLAHALEMAADGTPEGLGARGDWLAEWKWDGIRAQLVRRGGAHFLWSRGEELITDRFPEFALAADFLPEGCVLDGELLAWDVAAGAPLPFAALQKRITRKSVPKKLLAEAPARMLAYDLLEEGGEDLRQRPLAERRARLEAVLAALPRQAPVGVSPLAEGDWPALAALRQEARAHRAEGLMLKRAASPYHVGRKRGDWWKWKLDPLTIDAVMIYAQAGSGRRANLFTDFTFAVRDGEALVPFTKAYSGLTDEEFRQITAWVRRNTENRFGPVRQVRPEHVFEIAFEGIQASPRHKSGVALRFPRMLSWRHDKRVDQADTLEHLRAMLAEYG